MPSIKDAVQRNQMRYEMGGRPGEAPPPPSTPTFTPQHDLPMMCPQRGMFPANVVLASDRSDSSREYRGAGARSATFPFPNAPIIIQQK